MDRVAQYLLHHAVYNILNSVFLSLFFNLPFYLTGCRRLPVCSRLWPWKDPLCFWICVQDSQLQPGKLLTVFVHWSKKSWVQLLKRLPLLCSRLQMLSNPLHHEGRSMSHIWNSFFVRYYANNTCARSGDLVFPEKMIKKDSSKSAEFQHHE